MAHENGRQPMDAISVNTVGSQFDEESSWGSDSEVNGFAYDRQTDRYGFIGGAQKHSAENAQDVPPEVLRQREVKWLDMLNHWDKWLFKRHKKVRLRCQKGVPPSLRGRAWLYLSGAKVKKEHNRTKFKELDDMQGDPKWLDVIERDLHRQFPFHEMFVSRGGHGQQDLLRVLKAYTLYRPDEGYCQAQAPIAAVLLMHMPAEDAFWCLVQICEHYLPGYYSAGLEAIQLDGEILNALLRRVSPVAYRHLDKHKIEPILYMTEWFMCAFSRTLPWASVLRVWDMFLCDGVKIIFRVGLVLLRCMLGTKEKLKACQGQYETMELLRAIEPKYMQEAFLVQQVLELPVSVRDVERENHVQLKRWRKKHGELSYKSAPRMHGALAIMATEPHRRQDFYQNPTIIVPSPLETHSSAAGSSGPPSSSSSQQGTPQLSRATKKRGTLRKAPKPIPDIPNPYALPTDAKSMAAPAQALTPAPAPAPATTTAVTTASSADTQPEPAGTGNPSTSEPVVVTNTPVGGSFSTPLVESTTTLQAPAPTVISARSPSPHPPMFYQPPPQQPINNQPSPSHQPMSSQPSPSPQRHMQQQANGQPPAHQHQPISSQPISTESSLSAPQQQPITSQPQRQHPPMFYQPPPQQPIAEVQPAQPMPPPPSSLPPPPPHQPITVPDSPPQPITDPPPSAQLEPLPTSQSPIKESMQEAQAPDLLPPLATVDPESTPDLEPLHEVEHLPPPPLDFKDPDAAPCPLVVTFNPPPHDNNDDDDEEEIEVEEKTPEAEEVEEKTPEEAEEEEGEKTPVACQTPPPLDTVPPTPDLEPQTNTSLHASTESVESEDTYL